MRIELYSCIASFWKIPFREIFRIPLLSLPGTFRDSVFLNNLSNLRAFPQKSDEDISCLAHLHFCPFGWQGRLLHFSLPDSLPESFRGVGRLLLETHLLHRSPLRSRIEPIPDQKNHMWKNPSGKSSGFHYFPFREPSGTAGFWHGANSQLSEKRSSPNN